MKFKRGKSYEVGGDGTGWTMDSPFYWYRHTDNWKAEGLNNSNSPESSNRRIYFRVKLKAGVNYTIATYGDFDGKIWLYDINGNEITYNDDDPSNVEGTYFSDTIWYTPSADGLFIFGAGAYSSGTGDMRVCCYPAPEQEEIPDSTKVYETSSGFDSFGFPIKYDTADMAEVAFKTHPKKNLVLRYDFKSLTAETGEKFTVHGGNVEFKNINGVQCIKFDGKSYLRTNEKKEAQAIVSADEATVSVWVQTQIKATWTGGECAVVYRGRDGGSGVVYYMTIDSAGGNFAQFGGTGGWNGRANSDYTFPFPSNWVHFLGIKRKGTNVCEVYINGQLRGTNGYSFAGWNSDEMLTIGCGHELAENKRFNGYMAKLRVYNRALTQKEIDILAKEIRNTELYIEDGTPAYFSRTEDTDISTSYLANIPKGNEPCTVSLWYKNVGSGRETLLNFGKSGIDCSYGFILQFYDNKLQLYRLNSNGGALETAFPANQWVNIVVMFDGTTCYVYVNNELAYSDTPMLPFVDASTVDVFRIGGDYTFGTYQRGFIGNITNLNVYNRVLSAEEVTALYNKQDVTNGRVLHVPLASGQDDDSMFSSKNFIYAEV